MSDEDELLTIAAAIIIDASVVRRRKRRFWVRASSRSLNRYNGSDLIKDLIVEDDALNSEYRCDAGFRNFFRMTNSDFEFLLSMIGHKIKKKDTSFRPAIPAAERLAVTLRFFATGDSYHSLMCTFKISKQLISAIVPEVCDALIDVLGEYIKMPETTRDWEVIAKQFNDRWNFPNCVGAMDGKHIALQAPIHSGSEFYNKSFFSIVLLAVVDGNYNFIYANVGCQGRISDGGVFNKTYFKKCLDNTMNLPSPCTLPGRNTPVPFVFVADEAFPLLVNLMKPFSGVQDKGSKNRIYNYRVSRARSVSENAFGIMSSVFRIFRKPMLLEPEKAVKVTLTILHLHNFLRKNSSKYLYNPPGVYDSECTDTGIINPGLWRQDSSQSQLLNIPRVGRRSALVAQQMRTEFCEYFNSPEGEVHFQNRM